jgi:K+-transporting ATPase KdpF subunit
LKHDRFDLHRRGHRLFRRERALRPRLRKIVRRFMENIIVGLVSLALFIYLLVAMLQPEKF